MNLHIYNIYSCFLCITLLLSINVVIAHNASASLHLYSVCLHLYLFISIQVTATTYLSVSLTRMHMYVYLCKHLLLSSISTIKALFGCSTLSLLPALIPLACFRFHLLYSTLKWVFMPFIGLPELESGHAQWTLWNAF